MRHGKIEQWFSRIMNGRYGADQFGLFLSVSSVALLLLSFLSGLSVRGKGRLSTLFFLAAMASLVYCSFRLFSKDFSRRRAENRRFMEYTWKARDWAGLQKTRYDQRKEYVFFSCPDCHQTMRVPRGKGKIRITCRRCGYSFDKKT